MDLELNGKIALVTGGGRGIGKAIARELALEGVDVVIAARTRIELESTAEELSNETGRNVLPIPADTGKGDDVRRMVAQAAAEFDRLDILVKLRRSAGRRQTRAPFERDHRSGFLGGYERQGHGIPAKRSGGSAAYAPAGLGPYYQHQRAGRASIRIDDREHAERERSGDDQETLPTSWGRMGSTSRWYIRDIRARSEHRECWPRPHVPRASPSRKRRSRWRRETRSAG